MSPKTETAGAVLLDDDRVPTRAGDTVKFIYGIPPVSIRAKIVARGKSLIALTPGHTPDECNLRTLRRYVGAWFRSAPTPPQHPDLRG